MALIVCPECKKKISDSVENCPNCGYTLTPEKIAEIKKKKQKTKKGCFLVIIIIFVLFIIGIIFQPSSDSLNGGRASASSEVVENSAWDGSVSQVKSWLKDNLKDPRSLEFINWSPVSKTKNGFMVRVKYRAKNSFGGYVVENKVFFLDSTGTVTSSIDYQK